MIVYVVNIGALVGGTKKACLLHHVPAGNAKEDLQRSGGLAPL